MLTQLSTTQLKHTQLRHTHNAILTRDKTAQKLRVQLIHPPQRVSAANLVSSVAIPPLGLAYLTATLEQAGHRVSVIDGVGEGLGQVFTQNDKTMQGLTFDEILDRIDPEADLIGMGIMFSCAWPPLRDLVNKIKSRFPATPIVLGGEHPTALPDLVFEQSPTDYIVTGEGEETLLELCDRIAQMKKRTLSDNTQASAKTALPVVTDIPGTIARSEGQIVTNPRRSRIRNIDDIPLPAWRYFDVSKYIEHRQPHGSADGRSMPMLATRGCPYQCTFCGSPGMWGTSWRPRSVDQVIDEMELYMRKYGANDFHFEDLTAVVRKDWILEFCREIIKRDLNVSWQLPSGTRSEAIDTEVASAMYGAGCRQFSYAFESGSPEMLKRIKKKIHIDSAFASARDAIKAGIRVQCIFIYGFPGETWKQMLQTYLTMLRCAVTGFREVSICALSPLPNTELFRQIHADTPIELSDEYLDSIFGYLSIWQQKSWNRRVPNTLLRMMILFSFASFFAVSFAARPGRILEVVKGMFTTSSGGKFVRVLKGLLGNARVMRQRQAGSTNVSTSHIMS